MTSVATTTNPIRPGFKTLIESVGHLDTPISRDYKKKERMISQVNNDTTVSVFSGWELIDRFEPLPEQTFLHEKEPFDPFFPSSIGEIETENILNKERAAEKTNQTRLELLARQYVGKLSKEEEARLEIVSERIRQLFPRVTVQDFEAIEEILVDVNRIGEKHHQLRKQLGLDSLE